MGYLHCLDNASPTCVSDFASPTLYSTLQKLGDKLCMQFANVESLSLDSKSGYAMKRKYRAVAYKLA